MIRDDHVTIVINSGRTQDEPGDVGSNFLPREVLDNLALDASSSTLRVVGRPIFGKKKLSMRNASRTNLE
jgi:hypothetical protein